MKQTVKYKDFMTKLVKEDYKENEIKHLFSAFRHMSADGRYWVYRWVFFHELPSEEVEGVTAQFLIDNMKFTPINAIISVDWLKEEPDVAKYLLLKNVTPDPVFSEEGKNKMLEFLRSKGVEPKPLTEEDLTDIDV